MILHNGDVLFGWPLQSHVITAGWFYNDGSLHRALDFRAAVGTPVYAAADGTVETAYRWNGRRTQGDTNSYGNMLKLRHADYRGGRLETLYAHLSKLCVAQGETVYEGQLIGYSGDTGNCYGAHLHFEVRYKKRRVHPLNWLDADFAAASTAVRLGGYQRCPPGSGKNTAGPNADGNGGADFQRGCCPAVCPVRGPWPGGIGVVPRRLYGGVNRMEAILVALITGGLSLLGVVITNMMAARRAEQRMVTAQAVTDARLEELTREVRAHNNFAQRVPVLEEQLRVANHRLSNLEKAHTPAGRAIS